jgi:protein TonB
MTRILFALTIAIGAHGLLLLVNLPPKPLRPPVRRAVTISLGYRHPEPPAVEKTQIEPQQPILPETRAVAPKQMQPTPKKREHKDVPIKETVRRPLPEPETPAQPEPLDEPREPVSVPEETAEDVDREPETEAGSVVRDATPLYRVNRPPPYPRMARRQGYEGTVVLEVLVDRHGRVGDSRVFSSSGYALLDKAAMAAVEEWLFEPGRRGHESVAMWVRVPIRFVLD